MTGIRGTHMARKKEGLREPESGFKLLREIDWSSWDLRHTGNDQLGDSVAAAENAHAQGVCQEAWGRSFLQYLQGIGPAPRCTRRDRCSKMSEGKIRSQQPLTEQNPPTRIGEGIRLRTRPQGLLDVFTWAPPGERTLTNNRALAISSSSTFLFGRL